MYEVSDVNWKNWNQEILESDRLTLIDFWHEHCPWCLRLNPIIEELAAEYNGKVKFVKLNVLESSENREIAIRHGVMATPTLIFFCAGKPVGEIVGFTSKEHLKRIIDEMLKVHRDCAKQRTELKL